MACLRILVCLAVFLSSLQNGVVACDDHPGEVGSPNNATVPTPAKAHHAPPHHGSPKQPPEAQKSPAPTVSISPQHEDPPKDTPPSSADDDPYCDGDDEPTPTPPVKGPGPSPSPPVGMPKPSPGTPVEKPKPSPSPPAEKTKPSPNPPVKGPKPSPSPPVGKSPTPNPPGDPPCEDKPTPSPPAKAPAPPVEKPKPSPSPPAEKPSPAPVKQNPTPSQVKKSAPSPTPVKPSAPTGGDSETSSQANIDAYLKSHNTFRAQHGAAPLVWNDELASKAKQWASNCKMVHSGGKLGPYGENLAASAGSPPSIAGFVKMWTDESSSYNPNNPVYSHFTQVVWKATTDLGCYLETCNNSNIFDFSKYGPTHFLVCEYYPPGNYAGQYGKNVQP